MWIHRQTKHIVRKIVKVKLSETALKLPNAPQLQINTRRTQAKASQSYFFSFFLASKHASRSHTYGLLINSELLTKRENTGLRSRQYEQAWLIRDLLHELKCLVKIPRSPTGKDGKTSVNMMKPFAVGSVGLQKLFGSFGSKFPLQKKGSLVWFCKAYCNPWEIAFRSFQSPQAFVQHDLTFWNTVWISFGQSKSHHMLNY